MGEAVSYTYYANSKFVYADLTEGMKNDTLDMFITRENWTDYDLWYSNLVSNPADKNNIYKPIPDYFIYRPPPTNPDPIWHIKPQNEAVKILSDPNDPRVPSNFKILYKSNATGVIVYKINHKI